MSLIEPLHWYWSHAYVDEEPPTSQENEEHARDADGHTLWLVILMEFTFATGEVVSAAGGGGGVASLATQLRAFTAATHNLFARHEVEKVCVVQESADLATLGLPLGNAARGRLRCLRPEAVNAALYDIASRNATGQTNAKGWRFGYELSAAVKPLWRGGIRAFEGGGDRGGEDPVRRRIRGKSRPPAGCEGGEQLQEWARERQRVRPLHRTAVAATTFTLPRRRRGTYLDTLARHDRIREEKRLMHNRAAEVDPRFSPVRGVCRAGKYTTSLREMHQSGAG